MIYRIDRQSKVFISDMDNSYVKLKYKEEVMTNYEEESTEERNEENEGSLEEKYDELDKEIKKIGGLCEEIVLNTQEQGQTIDKLIKNQINVKDEMINKLHSELSYYKKDQADRIILQLIKEVIKIRRDMMKIISSDKWTEMTVDDLRAEYQYSLDDITDLLDRQNVEPYSSKTGDDFDRAIHEAKIEITDDPSLDKKVKESRSEGYTRGDKVILPEKVVVYQYKNK